MFKIQFAKVNENAIIPTKNDENAGWDVYACFDENHILIEPHETKLIPTGIASIIPEDKAFIAKERGSTGSKGMALRCGVIDSSYRGEWFIAITNTTEKIVAIVKDEEKLPLYLTKYHGKDKVIIYPYTKAIAQVILVPVFNDYEQEEITFEELQQNKTQRGNGALGSSGK